MDKAILRALDFDSHEEETYTRPFEIVNIDFDDANCMTLYARSEPGGDVRYFTFNGPLLEQIKTKLSEGPLY